MARDRIHDFGARAIGEIDECADGGSRALEGLAHLVAFQRRRSPGREPVLKGKVRRWLARWDDVLAYCEAPQHAGGGGAVVVLLRGR